MIDEHLYLAEMQAGIRTAFDKMIALHPNTMIYSISVWTDEGARKSAVSFDTFENSEKKCRRANEIRGRMREDFMAAGITRRVPPDKKRNNEPADFEFQKVVVIENLSLAAQPIFDNEAWEVLSKLLEQIKQWAARESAFLTLHPDAELGISGRKSWYGSIIKIPAP